MGILSANLILNTILFWFVLRIYVAPGLPGLEWEAIALPIVLLHSSRHLGLMFLSAGATYPGLPITFAWPAAIGDFMAALIAAVAAVLIVRRARGRRTLVWAFNIWGSADLLAAITLATAFDVESLMGPAYWIPAFWVPLLLATHAFLFLVLVRTRPHPGAPAPR